MSKIKRTNNLTYIASKNYTEEEFADYLWNTLDDLGAARMYLYSLLPRGDSNAIERDYNSIILKVNEEIKRRLPDHPYATYIDVHDKFLDNGKLIEDYYQKYRGDLLHLSWDGYAVLAEAFEKALADGKPGEIVK